MFCSGFQARWRNLVVSVLVASSLSCSAVTGAPKLSDSVETATPRSTAALIAQPCAKHVARSVDVVKQAAIPHTDSNPATPEADLADAEESAPDEAVTLRRLPARELNRALVKQARAIILENYKQPFGTEIPFEVDGKRYVGRIEKHFHPVGGPAKPWGWHHGCSLFAVEPVAQPDSGA
jgi:hypothetical protein